MSQALTTTRRRRKPAHRAETPTRSRLASIGGLLTTTAIIGVGAFLGLSGVGETYASLNDSATSSGATISAGSMALAVGVAGAEGAAYTIPPTAWTNLFPGDSVRQQVSVKVNNNPSRISSAMTIRTTAAVPAGYELRVLKGTCPVTALTGTALSITDVSFGTWGPAETSLVCVEVKLRLDAPNTAQNATVAPIGMTVTAKQQ